MFYIIDGFQQIDPIGKFLDFIKEQVFPVPFFRKLKEVIYQFLDHFVFLKLNVVQWDITNIGNLSGTNTGDQTYIAPRVSTETSSATPTINTDNVDAHSITAQAADITSMTTNLSWTPTNFQKLIIRLKDDGTARAITWWASFEAKWVDLPTTTTASKVLTVWFIYDSVTSKRGCVASTEEV